jgi:hypothetical protein
MRHPFLPLLLLGFAPTALVLWRLGWLGRARGRVLLVVALVALVAASVAAGGIAFAELDRLKLGLAAAVAIFCALRALDVAWLRPRRTRLALLSGAALLGWVLHMNFLAFHGSAGTPRTWLHLHDVAHYYLGSKYFDELGYSDLYVGMLRAEAERYGNRFKSVEARDLGTYEIVHVKGLLERSDAVKVRFGPERWRDFQGDVAFFRDALGPQWGEVLRDHGFNPTPVWAWLGGWLANRVEAGSARGILVLCALDPLLLAATFAAVAWAFGAETMLLAMLYYTAVFGASFGWTGGAFLRFAWLFGVVAGVCCLARGRTVIAGSLLALSASLRVFPALFAVGMVCRGVRGLRETGRIPRATAAGLGAFALTGLVLCGATLVRPGGLERWQGFATNMERHLAHDAPNVIGLVEILEHRWGSQPEAEAGEQRSRRAWIHAAQLAAAVPLVLVFLYRRSARDSDLALAAAAILLVFVTLRLAAYYYAFLVLLVAVFRNEPAKLALLFGVEAATYALASFDDRQAVVFLYRNLLVALLLVALYLAPAREEVRALLRRGTAASP